MANPVGRPVKYTPEVLEAYADDFLKWQEDNPKSFWFKDWCILRDIDPTRLHEFAKANEKFSRALKKAKATQESRMVKGAIDGTFHSTFTIFALKNVAGWRDKSEVDTNVNFTFADMAKVANEAERSE